MCCTDVSVCVPIGNVCLALELGRTLGQGLKAVSLLLDLAAANEGRWV